MEPAVARQLAQVRARLEAGPRSAALYGEAARHYHAYALVAAAEACYREAERLDPDDFRWPYLLGMLALEDHRSDEAARRLERTLAREDKYYPALVRLSGLYLALGRTAEAVPLIETARRHAPEDPALLGLTGELALAQGRNADAVADLVRALEREPRATRLRYVLGMAYRAQGRLDAARAQLAQAGSVGSKPRDPVLEAVLALRQGESSYMLEGHAAFRAGDFGAAATAYRLALEQGDGASLGPLVNLAAAEARLGRVEAAIGLLRRAQALSPGDPSVLSTTSARCSRTLGGTPRPSRRCARSSTLRPGTTRRA